MSEKYKIGDISKLLGIPAQTLRYYEEQGIVSPHKDEMTGYRYYDAWDLNNLIDSVYYRALDFSINQTQEIINEDDLEGIKQKFMHQEVVLIQKIEKYKKMLEITSKQRQKITHFKDHLKHFQMSRCPGLLFCRYRMKNTLQLKNGDTRITELQPEIQEWMDNIPNVTPTFTVPINSLEGGYETMQYWWGWSMPVDEALQAKMQINEYNEYLPSVKSLYTVFEAYGEGTFAKSFYEDIFSKIDQDRYVISGDPVGRLVTKTHDKFGMHRYFETWIPIADI